MYKTRVWTRHVQEYIDQLTDFTSVICGDITRGEFVGRFKARFILCTGNARNLAQTHTVCVQEKALIDSRLDLYFKSSMQVMKDLKKL